MPPNLGGFFMVRSYYPRSEERFSGMPRPISYAVFCLKKKRARWTGEASCWVNFETRLANEPLLRHGILFFTRNYSPQPIHSFPTRRSSDLMVLALICLGNNRQD